MISGETVDKFVVSDKFVAEQFAARCQQNSNCYPPIFDLEPMVLLPTLSDVIRQSEIKMAS